MNCDRLMSKPTQFWNEIHCACARDNLIKYTSPPFYSLEGLGTRLFVCYHVALNCPVVSDNVNIFLLECCHWKSLSRHSASDINLDQHQMIPVQES